MRTLTLALVSITCLTAIGCKDDVGVDDPDPELTSLDAIVTLIEDGAYSSWVKEPAIADGPGPHGDKLVYFDPLVAASLAAGNETHPRGSTLVKELYGASGDLRGYAIAIKDREEASRDAWVWYEVFGSDYRDPAFWARGTDACANCHSAGVDYVLSTLPAM